MDNLKYLLKKYHQQSDFGLIILFFMVTVYPFIVIPGNLPYFYGPRYFVLLFVSLFAAVLLYRKGFSLDIKTWLPLLVFIFTVILSTLLSENVLQAWRGSIYRFTGLSTYISCVVLFVLASQTQSRNKIIEAMVAAAAIMSVIAIMQRYGFNIVPHEPWRVMFHSYGTLAHPNFFGTYTAFILPAAMMLYLHQKKKHWLASSALIFAGLMASLTRGAWLAFAAVILLFIYYVFKHNQLRKQMLTIIVVFIAVYFLFNISSNNIFSGRISTVPVEFEALPEYTDGLISTRSSVSIRIYIWQESVKIIADNWVLGVGPDNLRIPVPQGFIEDKAFNIFLEIAATMGIFALISYLVLIYFSLKNNKGWFGTLLSLMIIAYLLQGQFNVDVVMNLPLFWIVLGLTWAKES